MCSLGMKQCPAPPLMPTTQSAMDWCAPFLLFAPQTHLLPIYQQLILDK